MVAVTYRATRTTLAPATSPRRLCGPGRGDVERDLSRRGIAYGTTASASISTSNDGSMSLLTSTIDVPGRMSPKTSP